MGNDSPGGPGSPWTDLTRPPLRVAALRRALLGRGGPWTSLDVVTSTGSTNADLAAAAATGTAGAGAVLVAEHQVAGRGRRDRVWVAPPRSSLAVSVLLVPDRVPQARWSWLPLLVGVGVASALAEVAGVQTGLKWPNDVLARMRGVEHGVPGADDLADGDDGAPDDDSGAPDPADDPAAWHKVCGILAEVVALPDDTPGASARRGVVIGIGLNVGQRADELPAQGPGGLPAGSLTTLGASTTDRDTVLRSVLRAVGELYETWIEQESAAGGGASGAGPAPGQDGPTPQAHTAAPRGTLAERYRASCATVGHDVVVHLPGDRTLSGRAIGVDDDGRLLVAPAGGAPVESLAAGDVVHVRSGPERVTGASGTA